MLTGKTNEEKIWNYLKGAGLNDYGIAGLMGNLYTESGLAPNNLQNTYEKSLGYTDEEYTVAVDKGTYGNFIKDAAGYGLAQWTFWRRKQALWNYARRHGESVGDRGVQLDFIVFELGQDYPELLDFLRSTQDIYAAADRVCREYERPAVNNVDRRYSFAMEADALCKDKAQCSLQRIIPLLEQIVSILKEAVLANT